MGFNCDEPLLDCTQGLLIGPNGYKCVCSFFLFLGCCVLFYDSYGITIHFWGFFGLVFVSAGLPDLSFTGPNAPVQACKRGGGIVRLAGTVSWWQGQTAWWVGHEIRTISDSSSGLLTVEFELPNLGSLHSQLHSSEFTNISTVLAVCSNNHMCYIRGVWVQGIFCSGLWYYTCALHGHC